MINKTIASTIIAARAASILSAKTAPKISPKVARNKAPIIANTNKRHLEVRHEQQLVETLLL